ncbi:MAG: uroporphyrinogen decarboxylase, partial [Gammaproteobacteria bacterium]|nr:uroporphyrinogen decarboxylase [Gammaproteobacteria bacterium]
DAVTLIRRELDGRVPLIGFSGSPWTLATYMVEGGGSKDFTQVKTLLFADPAAMHQLLGVLSEAVSVYLRAQIEAGAQAVMIFDTWGGVLTSRDYQRFSLDYMARIVSDLRAGPDVPIVVFTKGGGLWLETMADCGCDALGLDWTMDMGRARALVGDRVALQGNMDPNALHAPPERIRDEVRTILESFGTGPGHVFNLGHGIQPHTDPDHVQVLVDAVHEFSAASR